VPRLLVSVEAAMVPQHMRIRALRYADRIDACARRYGLAPELLFAIIHTESFFNPLARSEAGALGLMQLMPGQGAREAFRSLHRIRRVPGSDYILEPGNNILLGATYLYMLQRQFGGVRSEDNRRTLSIAAYNCGPGRLQDTVLSRIDVDRLSHKELVRLLRKRAPKETRDYVPTVESRMALYRGL